MLSVHYDLTPPSLPFHLLPPMQSLAHYSVIIITITVPPPPPIINIVVLCTLNGTSWFSDTCDIRQVEITNTHVVKVTQDLADHSIQCGYDSPAKYMTENLLQTENGNNEEQHVYMTLFMYVYMFLLLISSTLTSDPFIDGRIIVVCYGTTPTLF